MSSILDIENLVLDNIEAVGVLDIEDLDVEDENQDKVLDLEDDVGPRCRRRRRTRGRGP